MKCLSSLVPFRNPEICENSYKLLLRCSIIVPSRNRGFPLHLVDRSISRKVSPSAFLQRQLSTAPAGISTIKDTYLFNYMKSLTRPEDFWSEAASALVWDKKCDVVLDNSFPSFTKWFVGGKLSVCYNALDRHCDEGHSDQKILFHDSPVTNSKTSYTYKELLYEVRHLAGYLSSLNVKQGDRVIIFMPMIAQALIAILACSRIGAVHFVVFSGFAAKKLATRISHTKATVVICGSTGIQKGREIDYKKIVDQALELADYKPKNVIVYQRPGLIEEGFPSSYKAESLSALFTSVIFCFCKPLPIKSSHSKGEHCDKETKSWAKSIFRAPVLDNWGQTGESMPALPSFEILDMFSEIGWPVTASCVRFGSTLNPPADSAGRAVPGFDVRIVNPETGESVMLGTLGRIVLKLPLPPGALSNLWEQEDVFKTTYFSKYPGYYDTMDAGSMDADGYVTVICRIDDIINVSGCRISLIAIEESVLRHPGVAECAVDNIRGQIPIGLLVLENDFAEKRDQTIQEVISAVRNEIGPIAQFKIACVVPRLPKTQSGKIPRSSLVALAEGRPVKIPVTIEDASVYPEIKTALRSIGYACTDADI